MHSKVNGAAQATRPDWQLGGAASPRVSEILRRRVSFLRQGGYVRSLPGRAFLHTNYFQAEGQYLICLPWGAFFLTSGLSFFCFLYFGLLRIMSDYYMLFQIITNCFQLLLTICALLEPPNTHIIQNLKNARTLLI